MTSCLSHYILSFIDYTNNNVFLQQVQYIQFNDCHVDEMVAHMKLGLIAQLLLQKNDHAHCVLQSCMFHNTLNEG